jgi:hypothetical protein
MACPGLVIWLVTKTSQGPATEGTEGIRLKFVKPYKSIISSVTNQEVSDFIVLSGPNGTGKSHLLEAIANGATTVDDTVPGTPNHAAGRHGTPIPPQPIRLFSLGQLVMAAEQDAQGSVPNRGRGVGIATYGDRGIRTYHQIQSAVEQLTVNQKNLTPGSSEFEQELARRLQDDGFLSPRAIQEMLIAVSKPLSAFSRDDCRKYAPLLGVVRDPFTLTLSELFLSYYTTSEENSNAQWRKEKGKPGGDSALTDEEFAAQYGPAPWDLLNEALSLTGLKYQVNHPQDIEDDNLLPGSLEQFRNGLKAKVIDAALADVPNFAPLDMVELFQQLSSRT